MIVSGVLCGHNLLLGSKVNNYGYLKKFFHGRSSIHQQLIFNSDALVTLQYLRATSTLFDHVSHRNMRSNMICTGEHCYWLGQSVMMMLTAEQSSALNCEVSPCECFFRLFKDGEMFHSTSYKEGKSFRNDTVLFTKAVHCCAVKLHCLWWSQFL